MEKRFVLLEIDTNDAGEVDWVEVTYDPDTTYPKIYTTREDAEADASDLGIAHFLVVEVQS